MVRNKNIIEDFVDKQIENIPNLLEKRYTNKYIIIFVIFTDKNNTYYLNISPYQYEDLYNNKIKNVLALNDIYKSGDAKKIRSGGDTKLFCLKKEYEEFQKKLKTFIDDLYQKYFEYTEKNLQLKIHISVDKINPKKFLPKKGTYSNKNEYDSSYRTLYNPNGLWYSCGNSFHKYYHDKLAKKNKYLLFLWLPLNVYSFDMKDLKICKLNTCNKFYKFSQKYENPDLEKTYIDWDKVRKNIDGLEICPFITPKCSGINIEFNEIKSYVNLFYRKNLTKKQKSVLWSYNWEAASGVILKNFDKLEYKKINL